MLPAYAGMIPPCYQFCLNVQGAPRVCGDDPGLWDGIKSGFRCSPRMRG